MTDRECVSFLQWCLPRLGFRWKGFRKVRGQVCKRIGRRMAELGMPGDPAYRRHLESSPDEWLVLDSLCRVTISRFFRDRGVFEELAGEVLPALIRDAKAWGEGEVRVWSAGCGSGEEPYSISMLWELGLSPRLREGLGMSIVATDADPVLLERAVQGKYMESSLKDVPAEYVGMAFRKANGLYEIRRESALGVTFIRQDLRREMPPGPFGLILCRNLAFTYFDEKGQRKALEGILGRLPPGGFLVVGVHESLPREPRGLVPEGKSGCVYRRAFSP